MFLPVQHGDPLHKSEQRLGIGYGSLLEEDIQLAFLTPHTSLSFQMRGAPGSTGAPTPIAHRLRSHSCVLAIVFLVAVVPLLPNPV